MSSALPSQSPVTTSVLLDIHRLLTMVIASKHIAQMPNNESLHSLITDIEHDEITRILLSVAATVRLGEDRMFKEHVLHLFVGECGTLIEDVREPTEIKHLDLREACNKILHSRRMEPQQEQIAPGRVALGTHIDLHGTRLTKEWHAILDVIQFCQSAALALELVIGRT